LKELPFNFVRGLKYFWRIFRRHQCLFPSNSRPSFYNFFIKN
jgi:hypothetical protein